MYQTNKEESANIRNLFKKKYPDYKLVKNGHSTGTAYGWIQVVAVYPGPTRDRNDDQLWKINRDMFMDIKNVVGRGHLEDDIQTDYFCVNISFRLLSQAEWDESNSWKIRRKEARIKNQTCPKCGAVVKTFVREGYRYRRKCGCGEIWVHGCA